MDMCNADGDTLYGRGHCGPVFRWVQVDGAAWMLRVIYLV